MAYSHSIDDADPSITYSTAWDFITDDKYTMPQWSGTAHSTYTIGTTARLRFTGSAIAVICIIPTSGGGNGVSRASFSIDNRPAQEVHIPTTLPVQFEVEFWNSGPLPFGQHSLVITNIGNDAYFRLDRIDYDPTDSHAPRSSSASPPAQTLTVTQTQSVSSVTSSASSPPSSSSLTSRTIGISSNSVASSTSATDNQPSNPVSSHSILSSSGSSDSPVHQPSDAPLILGGGAAPTNASSSDTQVPIAAIVGGTLGGLLILLLVVFVIVVRRRRAGQPTQRLPDDPSTATPYAVESSHHTTSSSPGMTHLTQPHSNPIPASKAAMMGFASSQTPSPPHDTSFSPYPSSNYDIYVSSLNSNDIEAPDRTASPKESPSRFDTNRNSATETDAPPAYRNSIQPQRRSAAQ